MLNKTKAFTTVPLRHYQIKKKLKYFMKWKVMTNSKKLISKIVRVNFDNITKFEDFDFDNILIDEKSYEYISVYSLYKTLILLINLCILGTIK